jgi:hypothetical protein
MQPEAARHNNVAPPGAGRTTRDRHPAHISATRNTICASRFDHWPFPHPGSGLNGAYRDFVRDL